MSTAVDHAAEIVVPTVGRASLADLLDALAAQDPPWRGRVTVVDDRPDPADRLPGLPHPMLAVTVLRSGGRGPAAARNTGLRGATAPWVVFLDDDVVPDRDWTAALARDLQAADARTAGVQGRVAVPRPAGRASTDEERNVQGLETARFATADLAYRCDALRAVGGFDERYPRAYREDADLALRVRRAGGRIVPGTRRITHPVRPAGPWASITRQRGNRDDARMRWEHGRDWRRAAAVGRGRFRAHLATTGALALAAAATATGHRRLGAVALGGWAGLTLAFAWPRIAAGPRTGEEVVTMLTTSVVIPPVAVAHRLRGEVAVRSEVAR